MSDAEERGGPAANLLRSLVGLGGTLLAAAQTRVELLTTEISEDLERGVQLLLWAFVALLAGILGALLAGVTIIVYFWDSHRIAAAVCVTVAFLLLLRRRNATVDTDGRGDPVAVPEVDDDGDAREQYAEDSGQQRHECPQLHSRSRSSLISVVNDSTRSGRPPAKVPPNPTSDRSRLAAGPTRRRSCQRRASSTPTTDRTPAAMPIACQAYATRSCMHCILAVLAGSALRLVQAASSDSRIFSPRLVDLLTARSDEAWMRASASRGTVAVSTLTGQSSHARSSAPSGSPGDYLKPSPDPMPRGLQRRIASLVVSQLRWLAERPS